MTTEHARDTKDEHLRVFVPLHIGHSTTPWSVAVSIPMATITADAHSLRNFSILLGIVALVVLGTLVSTLVNRIMRPLAAMTSVARQIAAGDTRNTVAVSGEDEIAALGEAFNAMVVAQRELSQSAARLAAGDASAVVAHRSEHDELSIAMEGLRGSVQALISETATLTTAAKAGRLSARGNAANFNGAYRALVEGINETLDEVVRPINEASSVLDRLADSDLTARMDGVYAGDFARVKSAINAAAQQLDDALSKVSSASSHVAVAGSHIASGSQGLAAGASEQAASLEEVSASMHELSAMANQTAVNAKEAAQLSDLSRNTAQAGVQAMQRMAEAVSRIKSSSDATARIVRSIDEIAFQTNLLALNAAVEAARAGDAGRGFAAVAEEVRNLAKRSAEAASTTSGLIAEAMQHAEEGVQLNAEVLARLDEITNQVARTVTVVTEIASASKRQADGIQQVNKGVEQMNIVTQQVAANAEESASASEELSGQARMLSSLVHAFRISGSASDVDTDSEDVMPMPSGRRSRLAGHDRKAERLLASF